MKIQVTRRHIDGYSYPVEQVILESGFDKCKVYKDGSISTWKEGVEESWGTEPDISLIYDRDRYFGPFEFDLVE